MLSVVIIGKVWQPGQESVYESVGLGASVGWDAGGAHCLGILLKERAEGYQFASLAQSSTDQRHNPVWKQVLAEIEPKGDCEGQAKAAGNRAHRDGVFNRCPLSPKLVDGWQDLRMQAGVLGPDVEDDVVWISEKGVAAEEVQLATDFPETSLFAGGSWWRLQSAIQLRLRPPMGEAGSLRVQGRSCCGGGGDDDGGSDILSEIESEVKMGRRGGHRSKAVTLSSYIAYDNVEVGILLFRKFSESEWEPPSVWSQHCGVFTEDK
ncbi:hypothetical protein DFH07DRAFT_776488 [Mycena maculata]|uniref:Uncharacterized protein n=1 Tax=Mycena maculata TaxID=230809 RepID=A0AAD7IM20_9AGAR|nr:hypothetical protein DFH07DRAFT_776488 [Mycena maculata]